MARLPYLDRNDLAEADRDIFDRITKERGRVGNVFRMMAHAPNLLRRYFDWSVELRTQTQLDPKLRELAIMTVGRLTGAEYEFVHHWNIARRLGVPRDKLEQIADYERSPLFDEQERAVIRYAAQATRDVKVSNATFDALRSFLDNRRLMELMLQVASYNLIVRLLVPAQVELEPGVVPE